MTATITKPSTSSTTTTGRVTIPVYIGLNTDTCKRILDILRGNIQKQAPAPVPTLSSSISVSDSTPEDAQVALERRLKIDLQTLRFVLFDSMSRGVQLDLALRIQHELGDELEIISDKTLSSAFKKSLETYKYYANAQKN